MINKGEDYSFEKKLVIKKILSENLTKILGKFNFRKGVRNI